MAIDWDGLVLKGVMDIFGEPISYVPRGGAPIAITDAVFDEESAEIAVGEDGQMATLRKPTCGIRVAALGGAIASQSDTMIRIATGLAYIVKDVVPDGHGHIRLTLMTKGGQ
ncbi:MAG: hypothetical protein P4L68_08215 [Methylovirgula sp.]|nr:hypothetical protein [Methylovirgula sp.]